MVADSQGGRDQAGLSYARKPGVTPMQDHRRHFVQLAIGALVLSPLMRTARAQDFPIRPIRLVIPFPPGGIQDALGRPWAAAMKSPFGTVVVENVGGGGGEHGTAVVARATPDGYTLLIANTSIMVINPLAAAHVSYDPIKHFDAVSMLCHVPLAVTINPSLPVSRLRELADYARRNSGRLSYGTPGVGSLNQLVGEQFKLLVGATDIVHVPYRGAGPAIVDLLSGQIPVSVTAVNGQLLEFHR